MMSCHPVAGSKDSGGFNVARKSCTPSRSPHKTPGRRAYDEAPHALSSVHPRYLTQFVSTSSRLLFDHHRVKITIFVKDGGMEALVAE